jgi:import inner membrane translocase subunit TIM21
MAQRTKLVSLLSCTRLQATAPFSRATEWRTYATHSDRIPSSNSGLGQNATTESTAELLRRLEAESRRQGGSTGFGGKESVGPFPLGVGPSGRRKMWRPWRELGVSGKREPSDIPHDRSS